MTFHWPQFVLVTLMLIALGISLARHNQPQPLTNGYTSLISTIITLWLLYAGGFFGVNP